jgi:hypothetical protein
VTEQVKHWPNFDEEAGRFFTSHLGRPRALFDAFVARGAGSGRREGPRHLYWQTVMVFSFAALEAGLEDLLFAAHGVRRGAEGQPIEAGKNSPDRNPRSWLVEKRLQNPNSDVVSRALFQDFGVVISALPQGARFEVRRKASSLGGSGRGEARPGPRDWQGLRPYLNTLSYIRNATAHGDPAKLHEGRPAHCEGDLWLKLQNGRWSVQQPHALTALRTSVSVFNTVAVELAGALKRTPPSNLTKPDLIRFPDRSSGSGGGTA